VAWELIYVTQQGEPPAHRPARVDVPLERIAAVNEEGSWYTPAADHPAFVNVHYRSEDDAPAVLRLTC